MIVHVSIRGIIIFICVSLYLSPRGCRLPRIRRKRAIDVFGASKDDEREPSEGSAAFRQTDALFRTAAALSKRLRLRGLEAIFRELVGLLSKLRRRVEQRRENQSLDRGRERRGEKAGKRAVMG